MNLTLVIAVFHFKNSISYVILDFIFDFVLTPLIQKDIPVSLYCRTLVEMSEHKRAIHSLEMEIEQYEIQGLTVTDQAEIDQNKHKIT